MAITTRTVVDQKRKFNPIDLEDISCVYWRVDDGTTTAQTVIGAVSLKYCRILGFQISAQNGASNVVFESNGNMIVDTRVEQNKTVVVIPFPLFYRGDISQAITVRNTNSAASVWGNIWYKHMGF